MKFNFENKITDRHLVHFMLAGLICFQVVICAYLWIRSFQFAFVLFTLPFITLCYMRSARKNFLRPQQQQSLNTAAYLDRADQQVLASNGTTFDEVSCSVIPDA